MTSQGAEVLHRCGACGNDLRARARYCDVCGAATATLAPGGEFKQVTVLFADVVGSMRLAAALHPERLQAIMHELFNRGAAVVQRFAGTVEFTGDGLMAIFGAPVAVEDHALRACIAALEIQSVAGQLGAEVLRTDGVELRLRVGLNSGGVVAGDISSRPGRYTAVGHPVGMAQRMESAAPPGGVLCSASTARLVEDAARLGPIETVSVKGSDDAIPARRVLAVESERMVLGRSEGRLLGRDAELDLLRSFLETGAGGVVAVVGEPGLGKSRLVTEFTARASQRGADIVLARCESHTSGVAFRALARMLRALFGVQGLDAAQARAVTSAQLDPLAGSADSHVVFDAMGIADAADPRVAMSVDGRRHRLVTLMADAVRRRERPVVFVLEDAHWIDAPSDEVLADVAAVVAPSMLIVTYRPEFTGSLHSRAARRLVIRALPRDIAVDLVGQVLGDDPSVRRLGELIADTASGNPFFIEEIVRDLAGRDLLSGGRGGYRLAAQVDGITVPPTVQAVLAARIDRLPADTKSILNAAAVIGSRFDIESLQVLLPAAQPEHLSELVAVELIDQTDFVPTQRYCFHHPLVRTVAYESQLTATRATAHRTLATAIRGRAADADESASLIATHLEAAGDLVAAYHWHMRAADWLRPRDLAAARAQWECARRIADDLPSDSDGIALRIAPRAMLCSTALYLRDDLPTDDIYAELHELATAAGDTTSLALGMAGRIFSFCVNEVRVPDAVAMANELDALMPALRCDPATRSIVLNALAFVRCANCEFESATKACDEILALPGVPVTESAPALALRGFVDICLGNVRRGRRDVAEGTRLMQPLHPVNFASVQLYSELLVALGIFDAREWLEGKRMALARAESFGDIAGIVIAQWAYGTVLLRTEEGREEAVTVLRLARTNAQRYGIGGCSSCTITPDLAIVAARAGRRDEAIDELRQALSLYTRCFPVFAVFSAEALVGLLVERGTPDDLAEAGRILERWETRRVGAPGWEVWLPKARALLDEARGDSVACRAAAREYLRQCEILDARGRLDEARRLVDRSMAARTA